MNDSDRVLLICTVGGTAAPIVAALKRWRPLKVRFVHTPQTTKTVDQSVQEAAEQGFALDPGRYELVELPDGEDLASCIDKLRELRAQVEHWVSRAADLQVIVDLTGGTKCMSAAIATHASRWPCVISYVGGGQRTKEGVGIVVAGHEEVRSTVNPWDALGYQAVDDIVVLFDQHAFAAAENVASQAKQRVSAPDRRREFAALEQLSKAFDAWDRFEHASSLAAFNNVRKSANDVRAVLGSDKGQRVLDDIGGITDHLEKLRREQPPSQRHVLDLLTNAKRRNEEGRHDDAVARLYRAIEGIAQVALKERHGIEDTEKVPLACIPEPFQSEWGLRAKDDVVRVGLQDTYALLASLNDPLGEQFRRAELNGTKSPLMVRNRSILAHGFDRVPESVFDKLWHAALNLAGISENDLSHFPRLGERQRP